MMDRRPCQSYNISNVYFYQFYWDIIDSPSQRRSVLGVHWKDWCWSWNSSTLATWCKELTHLKRPWCWKRLRAGEEGMEDEMVGWHLWLNGHGFGWTPGVGDRQGGLVCCGSWGCKELGTTEQLNWTLHKLKAYSTMISYVYIFWNDNVDNSWLISQPSPHIVTNFFLAIRTFKIHSVSYFIIYRTI